MNGRELARGIVDRAPVVQGSGAPISILAFALMLVLEDADDADDGDDGDGMTTLALLEVVALGIGVGQPLIVQLEAGGYVQRSRDRRDHRKTLVRLTAKGRRVLFNARRHPRKVGGDIDPDER